MKNLAIYFLFNVLLSASINVSGQGNPCPPSTGIGNSVSFDGDDDQLVIAGPTAASLEVTGDQFTMEAWVNPTSNFVLPHILNKEGEYEMAIRNGEFEFAIANDWQWQTTGIMIPIATWSHFAVSYNGLIYSVYFNGIFISNITPNSTGAILDQSPNLNNFTIGGRQATFTSLPDVNFEGLIDEVRIWNVVRTPGEIAASFNTELIGNEPGLIGYFPFDEDPTLTSVVNNVDATAALPEGFTNSEISFSSDVPCIENQTQLISCPSGTGFGNSLTFNGTTDYVDINAALTGLDGLRDFAVEFWMKADVADVAGDRSMMFSHNAPAPGMNKFLLILNGPPIANPGQLTILDEDNGFEYTSNAVIGDDVWHHIAYSRENGTGSLYIDGVLDGTHPSVTTFSTNDRLSLGQEFDGNTTSDFFNGQLADVRIWSTPRTASQITASQTSELSGAVEDLIAYYKFEADAVDCSPNEFDGVFVGNPTINTTTIGLCLTNYTCADLYFPEVSIVKTVSNVSVLPNGNALVTFNVLVTNEGNTDLTNLSVTDDVAVQFGSGFVGIQAAPSVANATATATAPAINSGFDGSTPNSNLLNAPGYVLPEGESFTLEFTVEVDPNAASIPSPLENTAQVAATGLDPMGGVIVDDNNMPKSYAASSAILVEVPSINLAKSIASINTSTSGATGHFNVTYQFVLKNTGNTVLSGIELEDDLELQLGGAFVSVVGIPTASAATVTTNPNYDGGNNNLILIGGTLQVAESVTVTVEVEIDGTQVTAGSVNSATAFANNRAVSDLSDSGIDPESTNPNAPGNTMDGSDDPTPLGDCAPALSSLSCTALQVSVDQTCGAAFATVDFIPSGLEDCIANVIVIEDLFTFMVKTSANGPALPDLDPSTPDVLELDLTNFIGSTLTYEVMNTITGVKCWNTFLVEDKLGPTIMCPASPIQVTCLDDLSCVATPTAVDNCGGPVTIVETGSQIVSNALCTGQEIIKTYIAYDNQGKASAPCSVTIQITQAPFSPIDFPADVQWTCEQYNAYNGIILPREFVACIQDADTGTPIIEVDLVPGADDDNCPGGENDTQNGQGCNSTLVCNLSYGVAIDCASPDIAGLEDDDILEITGSGVPLGWNGTAQQFCKYNVSFEDEMLPICGMSMNTFKILRKWKVFNCCTNELFEDTQLIIVSDETAPVVSLPASEVLNANISNQGPHGSTCSSSGALPVPTVSDNCTGVDLSTVSISSSPAVGNIEPIVVNGVVAGYEVTAPPYFQLGTVYTVTYQVFDGCGNLGMASMEITVQDETPPTVICQGAIDFNLSGAPADAIFFNSVDDGSFDNCAPTLSYKLMRMDELAAGDGATEGAAIACNGANSGDDDAFLGYLQEPANAVYFDDEAFFCCEDVGDPDLMIVMLVFDVPVPPGPVDPADLQAGGLYDGRYNLCMRPVTVNDKVDPVLVSCPGPVSVLCTDLTTINDYLSENSTLLTPPVFTDACSFTIDVEVRDLRDQTCRSGTILREYTATDIANNTSEVCTQTITVLPEYNYSIPFPNDVDLQCGEMFNPADSLKLADITMDGCEKLGISIVDQPFVVDPDDPDCMKALRTYTIINWCTLDINNLPNPTVIVNPPTTDQGPTLSVVNGVATVNGTTISITSPGIYQYTQIIKDCANQGTADNIMFAQPTTCASATPAVDPNYDPATSTVTCGGAINLDLSTVAGRCNLSPNATPTYFVITDYVDDGNGNITGTSFEGMGDGDPFGEIVTKGAAPDFTIQGTYPEGDVAFFVSYGGVIEKLEVVTVVPCLQGIDVIENIVGLTCSSANVPTGVTIPDNPNMTGNAPCLGGLYLSFDASSSCSTGSVPEYFIVTDFVDNAPIGTYDSNDGGTVIQVDPYGSLTSNGISHTIQGNYPIGDVAFVLSYGNADPELVVLTAETCFELTKTVITSDDNCANLNFIGNRANVTCGGKFSIKVEPGLCNPRITSIDFNYYEINDTDGDGVISPAELANPSLIANDPYTQTLYSSVTGFGFVTATLPQIYAQVELTAINGVNLTNTITFDYDFLNADCILPNPILMNPISKCFDVNEEVTILLSEIDGGSNDGCDINPTITLTEQTPVQVGNQVLFADGISGQTSLTLNIDDHYYESPMGSGNYIGSVRLVIVDAAGNENSGTINLNATINCGKGLGRISTLTNQPVEDVQVSISGDYSNTFTTTADGTFEFENIPSGSDVTVTAEKNIGFANGLTTYDLYLIGQHLLGLTEFDEPCALIAADADNSGYVSAFDITSIRRVILGLDQSFRNNSSWRFFDAQHIFANPTNPWAAALPETLSFTDVQGDLPNLDFTGVKIGDVNMSAFANSQQPLAPRTLTGTFTLTAKDAQLKAGEAHTLNFTTSNEDALGYQLTLTWDPSVVEVINVLPGAHPVSGFGTHLLSEGKLTMSHDGDMAGELFALELRALQDGIKLSEVFTVGSSITTAEAFAKTGPQSVALDFGNTTHGVNYSLEQNRPNPFAGSTQIGFTLAQAGEASLIITDVTGRVVWRTEGYFEAGFEQIEIAAGELPASGLLNYTLTAGDFTATRKMLVVR